MYQIKNRVNWNSEKKNHQKTERKFPSETLELRVDANGAFSYEEAKIVLQELAELEIHSIEQPIKSPKSKIRNPKIL